MLTTIAAAPASAETPPPPHPEPNQPRSLLHLATRKFADPSAPRSITGAPLPSRSTAAGRRRPRQARLWPSQLAPSTPLGSSWHPPSFPPHLPRRRRASTPETRPPPVLCSASPARDFPARKTKLPGASLQFIHELML